METLVNSSIKVNGKDQEMVECACGKCKRLIPATDSRGRKRKYLHGHHVYGNKNPRWNNGKTSTEGYNLIRRSNRMQTNHKGDYVMEHRSIYEEAYNCCLLPWTHIHHINGDKKDNRISNLQAASSQQHNYLDRYGRIIDHSLTRCCKCGTSNTTYNKVKSNGVYRLRPKWYVVSISSDKGAISWQCDRCYDTEYSIKNAERIRLYKKQYRAKNIEEINQRNKEYYLRNKERISLQNKEYNLRNKEQRSLKRKEYRNREGGKQYMKEYHRQHYQKNKQAINEKNREYYWQNKQRDNERSREYQAKNKERIKLQNAERYRRRKKLERQALEVVERLNLDTFIMTQPSQQAKDMIQTEI